MLKAGLESIGNKVNENESNNASQAHISSTIQQWDHLVSFRASHIFPIHPRKSASTTITIVVEIIGVTHISAVCNITDNTRHNADVEES